MYHPSIGDYTKTNTRGLVTGEFGHPGKNQISKCNINISCLSTCCVKFSNSTIEMIKVEYKFWFIINNPAVNSVHWVRVLWVVVVVAVGSTCLLFKLHLIPKQQTWAVWEIFSSSSTNPSQSTSLGTLSVASWWSTSVSRSPSRRSRSGWSPRGPRLTWRHCDRRTCRERIYYGWDQYIADASAYNRSFPCMEAKATYPYAIKTQWKARNTPSRAFVDLSWFFMA